MKIALSFWGVRGSIAIHPIGGSQIGGNSACVAIHYDKRWFVCDAGTGIRPLGLQIKQGKEPIALFLSHLHWDHIFGLPFFKPLYQRGREIFLAGPAGGLPSFRRAFDRVMIPPFFPIKPSDWAANVKWRTLKEQKMKFGEVFVEARRVKHRGETFAFKFIFPDGRKIIYATDHEIEPFNKKFEKWIQGVDVLIHDSQYDRKKYARRKNWGHSPFESVLEMAIEQKVKRLILFHHDPEASDRLLEERLRKCRKSIQAKKSKLRCVIAEEGLTLSL